MTAKPSQTAILPAGSALQPIGNNSLIGKYLEHEPRPDWALAQVLQHSSDMVAAAAQLGQINVLASEADWAWPRALEYIFRPRGVNLLMANSTEQFLDVLGQKRIHTAIVDTDLAATGLATIRVIRMDFPLVPCIALTSHCQGDILGRALELEVFGVIDKPVDMDILRRLLDRLFIKKYNCPVFTG